MHDAIYCTVVLHFIKTFAIVQIQAHLLLYHHFIDSLSISRGISSYAFSYSAFLFIICDTWDVPMLKILACSLQDFPPLSIFSLISLQLSSSESSRLVCLLLLSAISFPSLSTVSFVISCIFETRGLLTWAAQIILLAFLPYSLLNKKFD